MRKTRPNLLPVDDELVTLAQRQRFKCSRVRPRFWLGECKAAGDAPACQLRQVLLLLFFCAIDHKRLEGGKIQQKLVGTILFHEVEGDQGPPWFQNKHVDSFSQFAVDPAMQGRGVGGILLDQVEKRAAECGATEIACSMADPDEGLKKYYLKRGYRFVEHWQWPYTNYKSAILSKPVSPLPE